MRRRSTPPGSLEVVLLLGAALTVSFTGLPAESSGPFIASSRPSETVLYYEAGSWEVRPVGKPLYLLQVFGDGRVVGKMPVRDPLEWRLSRADLDALVSAVGRTGVLQLAPNTDVKAYPTAPWDRHAELARLADSSEWARLTVRLDGYRPGVGEPFRPVALDVRWDRPQGGEEGESWPGVAFDRATDLLRRTLREGFEAADRRASAGTRPEYE